MTAYQQSRVLFTFVELGISKLLNKEKLTAEELAKKKKKEEKLRSKTQRRPDDPQGDDQPADGQPNGDAAAPDQPTGAPGA